MKSYIYKGKSNLTFSHGKEDFLIHGEGPHDLPEESPIVKSNVTRGKLVLQGEQTEKGNSKIKP